MGGEKGRPAWGSRTLPWCPNPQATASHAVLIVGRQTEGVATTDSSPRPSRPGPPHPECPHPVSPPLAAGPSQGLLTWPGPRPHLPQTLTLHTLNSIRVSRSPLPHTWTHSTQFQFLTSAHQAWPQTPEDHRPEQHSHILFPCCSHHHTHTHAHTHSTENR